MPEIPNGRLVKGPYEPICRDCAIYSSIAVLGFLYLVILAFACTTVDGSEIRGTPVDMVSIPLFSGFHTCQVVPWDFRRIIGMYPCGRIRFFGI